ncbi:hypothetical protein pipiens_006844 [Culex pipiens pipiens]|uniref:Uncharacterized protein n=1 Tax=Culex pipiens pipiens TaxID=38569 RepID=A0ABD1DNQ7_CULPP
MVWITKTIQLVIIEEGSYEKDVLLYVNLGEPQQVGDDELTGIIEAAESKAAEDLTEEDKMALLGRPKAGDIVRAQLRIKESKEFKVSVIGGFLCALSFRELY